MGKDRDFFCYDWVRQWIIFKPYLEISTEVVGSVNCIFITETSLKTVNPGLDPKDYCVWPSFLCSSRKDRKRANADKESRKIDKQVQMERTKLSLTATEKSRKSVPGFVIVISKWENNLGVYNPIDTISNWRLMWSCCVGFIVTRVPRKKRQCKTGARDSQRWFIYCYAILSICSKCFRVIYFPRRRKHTV